MKPTFKIIWYDKNDIKTTILFHEFNETFDFYEHLKENGIKNISIYDNDCLLEMDLLYNIPKII